MVKVPRPGRVKTRLARDIGRIDATWWFRRQCAALMGRLRDPRWDIVLAVAPDREGMQSRVFPADLQRRAQGRGHLGTRMRRQLNACDGAAVLIGADIPGIERAMIAEAFRALRHNDMVFGPAPDGGYWLIGRRAGARLPSTALEGVRWSTQHALSDTKATLAATRIAYVTTLRDVDTGADLAALRRDPAFHR